MKKILIIITLFYIIILSNLNALEWSKKIGSDVVLPFYTFYAKVFIQNYESMHIRENVVVGSGSSSYTIDAFYYTDTNNNFRISVEIWPDWKIDDEWLPDHVYHIVIRNAWKKKIADWSMKIEEDITAPVISITSDDGKNWDDWHSGSSFKITASSTDIGPYGEEQAGVDINEYYYQLDGGPGFDGDLVTQERFVTLNSAPYNNLANGKHTLYFRAADFLGNSRIQAFTILIDKTTPVITFTPFPDWTNNDRVIAAASATDTYSGLDSGTWEYITTGMTAWEAIGNPNKEITSEGETRVSFRVKDNAGNLSDTASGWILLDRTSPGLTTTLLDDSGTELIKDIWQSQDVYVKIDAGDTASGIDDPIEYITSLNAGPDVHNTITVTTPGVSNFNNEDICITADGITTIEVNIFDRAGNPTTQTITVKIDKSGPEINTAGMARQIAGVWTPIQEVDGWITLGKGEEAFVFVEPVDNDSGINEVRWSNDNGSTYSEIATATDDGSGRFLIGPFTLETTSTVYYQVINGAMSSITGEYTVQIDQTAPLIILPTINESWQAATSTTLLFTASDGAGSGFADLNWEVKSGNGDWAIIADGDTAHVIFNEPGEHNYVIRVTDKVGHTSLEHPFTLRLDPEVPGIGAEDTDWLDKSVVTTATINLTITDTSGVDITNVDNIQYAFSFNGPYAPVTAIAGTEQNPEIIIPIGSLPDGAHELYLKIKDRAGRVYTPANTGSYSCVVNIDSQPPVINSTTVPADWANFEDISILLSDAGSGINTDSFAYSFDGATYTTAGLSWPGENNPVIPITTDGEYPLCVRVSDSSGKVATTTITIKRDSEAPKLFTSDTEWTSGNYQWVDISVTDNPMGDTCEFTPETIQYRKAGETVWHNVIALETVPFLRVQVNIIITEGYVEQPVELIIYDKAHNPSEIVTATVKVDKAEPVFNIAAVDNVWLHTETVEIGLDGTGAEIDGASFFYGFSQGGITIAADVVENDGAWKAVIPGIPEGERRVYFFVQDTALNSGSGSAFLRIDRTDPVVTLNGSGSVNGASVLFTVIDNSLDTTSIWAGFSPETMSGDGISVTGGSGTWNVEVPVNGDGDRTLYLELADEAANMFSASYPLTLDSGGPDLVLSGPRGWVATSATASAQATDVITEVDTSTWYMQITNEADDYDMNNWINLTPVPGNEKIQPFW